MTTQTLPTDATQWSYTATPTLDGVDYRVTLTYRRRPAGGSFYMRLADANDVELVSGRRLSPGEDPLAGLAGDALPPGVFVVSGLDPYQRADLGVGLLLQYVPLADVPAPTVAAVTIT